MFWTSEAKKDVFFLTHAGGKMCFFCPDSCNFRRMRAKFGVFSPRPSITRKTTEISHPLFKKKVKLLKYPLWTLPNMKSNGVVQKTTKEISQIFRFSPQSPWHERVRYQMHGRVQKIILSFVQNVTSPSAIWRTRHTMDGLVTKWTEESNAKMHDCVEKCTTALKNARTRPKNNPFLRAKCNESV